MTRAVAGLAHAELDERDLAVRVCRACVDGLGVDGAAISLQTGMPSRVTLAATDPVARLVEDLQFSLNEGACMEAAATGCPVLVPDLLAGGRTARWPLFAGEVVDRGVAALFALPLQWGAVNLGVLDLYRMTPGPLEDGQWRDAAAAVDIMAVLILGRRTAPAGHGGVPGRAVAGRAVAGASWLEQVTGYRAEIHQATGMVQVQLAVSGTDALARLRAHAFVHDRALADVAREVVERRLSFTRDGPARPGPQRDPP